MANREENKERVVGFLAVGLDNKDDHKRVTRSENFVLLGGSAATHERMQDIAIHFDETLKRRGKKLDETSTEEAVDLLRESLDK